MRVLQGLVIVRLRKLSDRRGLLQEVGDQSDVLLDAMERALFNRIADGETAGRADIHARCAADAIIGTGDLGNVLCLVLLEDIRGTDVHAQAAIAATRLVDLHGGHGYLLTLRTQAPF